MDTVSVKYLVKNNRKWAEILVSPLSLGIKLIYDSDMDLLFISCIAYDSKYEK